jgi:hypothetical protein
VPETAWAANVASNTAGVVLAESLDRYDLLNMLHG